MKLTIIFLISSCLVFQIQAGVLKKFGSMYGGKFNLNFYLKIIYLQFKYFFQTKKGNDMRRNNNGKYL